MMMLLLSLVLPSLMRIPSILSANALKGLTVCMNNQDCLGVHRECSHQDHELVGRCVCQDGYEQVSVDSIACDKKGVKIVNRYVYATSLLQLILHLFLILSRPESSRSSREL